jgi:transglutaminase-like putative cysteine protease
VEDDTVARTTLQQTLAIDSPTAAELAPTLEVQITPEITALAAELGNDPAAIFNYVYNNIEYIPYTGSKMGSTATLWAQRGNSYDQASLLIALLRAADIPARYRSGRIELTGAQAQNWLGVRDNDAAVSIVATYSSRTQQIGAGQLPDGTFVIQFDHVWVEAYVPYGNYRGTGADESDFAWIPLDPSVKARAYQPGIDVSVCGDFDYDDYLAQVQRYLPTELFATQIQECLNSQFPGKALSDVGYNGQIVPAQPNLPAGNAALQLDPATKCPLYRNSRQPAP